MSLARVLRSTFLFGWAILLAALTFVFAAIPLKSLRRGLGRGPYWLSSISVVFGLGLAQFYGLAGTFLSLVILIGLFAESEEQNLPVEYSAFYSLVATILVAASGFSIWLSSVGPTWQSILLAKLEALFQPAMQLSPNLKINVEEMMWQIPSALIICWMVALYLAVFFEHRVAPPLGSQRIVHHYSRKEVLRLRLGTIWVWVLTLGLLGAFGDFGIHPLQILSSNILNICVTLFFFQGLAVVLQFFKAWRLGVFWQTVLTILIVGQLFLLVSVLGLLDHWLDFRTRMLKRQEQMKKELP